MAKRILALDMATDTGFAHSSGASGVWDLSIRSDESSGMRLIRFESKVHEIAKGVGIDIIAFESVNAAAGPKINLNGVKLISKLQAIIERLSEIYEYECVGYNLSAIKAHAMSGKPKGAPRDKEAMIAAAKKRWPDTEIIDSNHADALFLLDLATKELSP